jgi:hypothetical protein
MSAALLPLPIFDCRLPIARGSDALEPTDVCMRGKRKSKVARTYVSLLALQAQIEGSSNDGCLPALKAQIEGSQGQVRSEAKYAAPGNPNPASSPERATDMSRFH